MNASISATGRVEIEFYVVRRLRDGAVVVWTEPPPAMRGVERLGPFVASANVSFFERDAGKELQ